MSRGKVFAGLVVLAAVGAGGYLFLSRGAEKATAQQPPAQRVVPVEVVTAASREMPVRLEALGTVTPIASVAIKARVELAITGVHFRDGATVKEGELLFTLDDRQILAEINRVEAVIAGAAAQQRRQRVHEAFAAAQRTPLQHPAQFARRHVVAWVSVC